MKITATVSALFLSALATSTSADAANRHSGSRRTVDFIDNAIAKAATLAKRVPLPEPKVDIGPHHVSFEAGMKKLKRQPLPNANAQPVAMPGFGSIPSMNDGNMPVIGCECFLNFPWRRGLEIDVPARKSGTVAWRFSVLMHVSLPLILTHS